MAVTNLAQSRAYPLLPADAFDRLLPLPLPDLFCRRYLAIPAIREVRDAPPRWEAAGQTRRIVLADGGTMLETLTRVDRPRSFGYTLTELTGAFSPLVASIDGVWSVDPVGTGARVTWLWDVHAKDGLGDLAMPVFGKMWQGYARQALAELEGLLVDGP